MRSQVKHAIVVTCATVVRRQHCLKPSVSLLFADVNDVVNLFRQRRILLQQ